MINKAVDVVDYIMTRLENGYSWISSKFQHVLCFKRRRDGGQDSPVEGFWVIEIKGLFSIVFLKFNPGSRENYHSHAFNAYTWWISGNIEEHRIIDGKLVKSRWKPSLKPKWTPKDNCHKVFALNDKPAWAFCLRGPWDEYWTEWNEDTKELTTLTHGRRVVKKEKFS